MSQRPLNGSSARRASSTRALAVLDERAGGRLRARVRDEPAGRAFDARCSSPLQLGSRQRGHNLHPRSSPTTATNRTVPRFVPATVTELSRVELLARRCPGRSWRDRTADGARGGAARPRGRARGRRAERFYVVLSGLFAVSQAGPRPAPRVCSRATTSARSAGDEGAADGLGAGAHAGGRGELRPRGVRRAAASALRRRLELREHGVGELRPGLERPRPEVEIVRHASAASASGSTQRNVPLPPKCPNVRGELREPVQCGASRRAARSRAPSRSASIRPTSGQHADQAGELDGGRLRRASRARPAVGRCSSARELQQVVEACRAAPSAAEPRSSRRSSERPEHRRAQVVGERHLGALRRPPRRAPRSRRSSRSAAAPAARSARRRSNGSPDACASRWRTVEPGGPAASSRSRTPSSAATSVASAVTSFVTDAQRKTCWRGPCDATSAPPRRTPTATVSRRPAVDLPQGVHRARY